MAAPTPMLARKRLTNPMYNTHCHLRIPPAILPPTNANLGDVSAIRLARQEPGSVGLMALGLARRIQERQ